MPQGRTEVQVRPGREADLVALTELYNHYIRETAVTFDTAAFTPEQRRPGCAPTLKTARTVFWLLAMPGMPGRLPGKACSVTPPVVPCAPSPRTPRRSR